MSCYVVEVSLRVFLNGRFESVLVLWRIGPGYV
jgi:hypothetical protein